MSELDAIQMPNEAAQTERTAESGWRELLELNRGRRVTAEFFLGAGTLVTKTGTIYAVQPDYFILMDDFGNYVAADLYSLHFVTFCPDCVAAQGTRENTEDASQASEERTQSVPQEENGGTEQVTAPRMQAVRTAASLAALNYAKRKARRLE